MKTLRYFAAAFILIAFACTSEAKPDDQTGGGRNDSEEARPAAEGVPFDFSKPDLSVELPDELVEISGVTVLSNGMLGAVQDELGVIFLINRETGAIESEIPFGDTGDYEGVEMVDDRLFVLMSNGTLIEVSGWEGGNPQTRTHKTGLKAKNDTEGIAYDARNGRLLISTKEDPGSGLKKDQKAIYAFDLATETLAPEPVYVLDAKAIERQVGGKGKFKPSALAVHPTTGEVYVMSSVNKSIAILNEAGEVQQVMSLSDDLYTQPEGLAFSPDGTLYLTSEGGKGKGKLFRFDR
jgi:uncharacterized protein YjiK